MQIFPFPTCTISCYLASVPTPPLLENYNFPLPCSVVGNSICDAFARVLRHYLFADVAHSGKALSSLFERVYDIH